MLAFLFSTAALLATASAAFDPLSKNNVITYWGQGANQERLIETCKNSAYDIINIGFVNVFPDQGKGGWPGTNFGNACWGDVYQNAQGVDTQLLKTCPDIGEDVIACQQTYGKKIFLSLGGGSQVDYYLKSAASARKFANFLWAAFGPASASTSDVPRPWGDAGVDGFDFDIESYMDPAPAGQPNYQKAFYADMIQRFKALFPTDSSKAYYISGAPQCIIPDSHFTDVLAKSWFDFLYIQFYNTEGCSARDGIKAINGKGDADISYLQWVASKSLNPNVRMSIGLPAAKKASGLGIYWLNPTEVQKLVKKFYGQKLFGGIMLWEATFAANNKVCGTDYGTWMKDILIGRSNGKDIKTTCPTKRDLSEYEDPSDTTSDACGEVTVTVKEQSTVYVIAGASSGDLTSQTTIQSTSTVYNTHTEWLTASPSHAGLPSGYENPLGDATSSPVSPASAGASHGHHHGHGIGHGHGHSPSSAAVGPQGGEQGPQSTTTIVNVVTVTPVPVTSTQAPYAYGSGAGNGTAVDTASSSASAWPSYSVMAQTGSGSTLSGSIALAMGAIFIAIFMS